MPNFEVFTKRMVPLAEKPYVTIQKRGNIAINRSAHAALGEPAAVELLYDPKDEIIGLRAVSPEVEHAYPLRPQGGKEIGPYLVAGIAFTKFYRIDTTVARRWRATMNDDVLCIDLKGDSTVVSSNRDGRGHRHDDNTAADR